MLTEFTSSGVCVRESRVGEILKINEVWKEEFTFSGDRYLTETT